MFWIMREKGNVQFHTELEGRSIQACNTNVNFGYQNLDAGVEKIMGTLKCLNVLKWYTESKMKYKWHYKFLLRKNVFD